MGAELINLTQLQAALTNQHKYNPNGKLEHELLLTSQGQELLYRLLSIALTQMNIESVSVSDATAQKAAAAAAASALSSALTAVSAEVTARANADTAEATARANADTAEATARANADTAEANARIAAFEAIPGYGSPGYGLSRNDLTDTLLAALNSALQTVAVTGDYWSGDGTAEAPLSIAFPLPAAPTEDGTYALAISGGVASWTPLEASQEEGGE
ncbi:MAG: hypothetical protein LBS51_09240 [Oscillospiraceae bacterium]|jgi:hypothetical protein|nr:hypothetical protein [Oscillospiraceae bacterium]